MSVTTTPVHIRCHLQVSATLNGYFRAPEPSAGLTPPYCGPLFQNCAQNAHTCINAHKRTSRCTARESHQASSQPAGQGRGVLSAHPSNPTSTFFTPKHQPAVSSPSVALVSHHLNPFPTFIQNRPGMNTYPVLTPRIGSKATTLRGPRLEAK